MKRHGEPLFWEDHSGIPHLHGVSAERFIETSSVVCHPLLKAVYVNVFSCKEFDIDVAKRFSVEYWRAVSVVHALVTRTGPALRCPAMGQLFSTIQQLVAAEKYVVGEHASERLEERGIMEWQAVAALADGKLIAEKPKSKPNPTVEVRESLPDGTEFKAVWSLLPQSGVVKLVTVHFFDRG